MASIEDFVDEEIRVDGVGEFDETGIPTHGPILDGVAFWVEKEV